MEPVSQAAYEQCVSDLHSAMRTFWHRSRRNLANRQSDITLVRLEVLSLLGEFGRLSIGEVAARSGIHPSTMTRVVDALEKRKLVRRSAGRRDRRSVMIEISAAGKRELREASLAQRRLVLDAIESLSPADRDQLFAAVPLLLRAAENMHEGDERTVNARAVDLD